MSPVPSDDPYTLLGVGRDATQDEIKRRYRSLAKELHPDLNPDKDVADRFKQVSAAYDFLSDPDKRARFDRGEIDAQGQERPQQRFYRDFAGRPDGAKYQSTGSASEEELHDLFADLFGEQGGPFAGGFRRRRRGADISYRLEVDFLDAARGAKRRVVMGDGRTLDLTIPAGVQDGQILRLRGQGQPGSDGGSAGDALVELAVRSHPQFERRDADIWLNLPISLAEAVLGGRVQVPTIDGPVALKVPRNSSSGATLRLRGRGVPHARTGQRGDQYVRLQIVLPKQGDPELERFIEGWAARQAYDPRADQEGSP